MTLDPRIQIVLKKLSTGAPFEISVRELAESVNLSPSRFSHLFALATGIPPKKFLIKRRTHSRRPNPS